LGTGIEVRALIFAIGDIHGEIWKLRGLLDQLEHVSTPEDRYVFLGDYVDRGPDTCGVIDLLLRVRTQRPNSVFLRGNHEQMMLDTRDMFESGEALTDFDTAANWFAFGGAETLESYSKNSASRWFQRVPETHWDFIRQTTIEYREGGYVFVHAGLLPPGEIWERGDPRLWIRQPFLNSPADLGGIVIYGHTPSPSGEPVVMPNKIGIDTGATYGGPLTAVALNPEIEFSKENVVFYRQR